MYVIEKNTLKYYLFILLIFLYKQVYMYAIEKNILKYYFLMCMYASGGRGNLLVYMDMNSMLRKIFLRYY